MAELVFYRHKFGKFLDHVVAWLSFGKYSHVEFRLPPSTMSRGVCMSLSWRDGGVRAKYIDVADGKWQRYQINPEHLSMMTQLSIAEWFDKFRESKVEYDTLGVLLAPYTWWSNKILRRDKWFCSELCSFICRRFGIYVFPTTLLSPNKMERICRAHPEIFTPLDDDAPSENATIQAIKELGWKPKH